MFFKERERQRGQKKSGTANLEETQAMAQTINRKLAQRHRFSTEDRRAVFIANINEALLQFDGEETFVEIETAGPQFERRSVETGLSDGINVEVVSGLTESDKIKDPNSAS